MKKYGEGCQGCIHWRSFDGYTGMKACHYILDEGVSRDCDAGVFCKHYSTDKQRLKEIKEAAERNSRRRGYAL